MTYRTLYTAEYLYPGGSASVDLPDATYEAAVVYGPDEPGTPYTLDGWYAVNITTQAPEGNSVVERYERA